MLRLCSALAVSCCETALVYAEAAPAHATDSLHVRLVSCSVCLLAVAVIDKAASSSSCEHKLKPQHKLSAVRAVEAFKLEF